MSPGICMRIAWVSVTYETVYVQAIVHPEL